MWRTDNRARSFVAVSFGGSDMRPTNINEEVVMTIEASSDEASRHLDEAALMEAAALRVDQCFFAREANPGLVAIRGLEVRDDRALRANTRSLIDRAELVSAESARRLQRHRVDQLVLIEGEERRLDNYDASPRRCSKCEGALDFFDVEHQLLLMKFAAHHMGELRWMVLTMMSGVIRPGSGPGRLLRCGSS